MKAVDLITEHLDIWTTAQIPKAKGRGKRSNQGIYGIKKLRELILELAVRGKLVAQNSNEESANNLLVKITDENKYLVNTKNFRKQTVLPEVSDGEKPFELPAGWKFCRIGHLVNSIISGGTPSKRNPAFWNGVIPWASVKDLGSLRHLSKTQDLITPEGLRAGSKLADIGDIIICTRMGLGKIAIATIPVAINQDLKAIKFTSFLDKDYFLNFFATLNIKGTGTTVSGIKQDQLLATIVALPPLAEQHRIVAKVDELMALCDQLEQQQTNNNATHQTLVKTLLATLTNPTTGPNNTDTNTIDLFFQHFDTLFTTEESIDQLKQTILQLGVMGKLVPQDPDEEPAHSLLQNIAKEKVRLIKAGKIKKQTALVETQNTKKMVELPDGWEWTFLGALVSVMDAGWSPACAAEPSPHDAIWGVLKTTAVQVMQYLEYENKTLPESLDPRPQYEVHAGDILITRAGPKNRVAISCLVQKTRPNLMISDKIIRFHLVEVGIVERYISLCLNAGVTAEYLEKAKSGMAESQMNISQAKLRLAPIAICPLGEQGRIITKINQLMELCDTLRTQLITARDTRLQLTEALVNQAIG